ncbi:MAG: DUF1330 domain-containing protein [Parvibaculum sp.]|nr:DUF1330 domain-containing protein [Parvibaculum sp.]|tara:strand:- start:10184 stop:10474 length:291 start_codon:yes stop_codon:yes gene_type:complete
MTVFVVGQLSIFDRESYGRYEATFMEVFQKYQGSLLAVDEAPKAVEGEWTATRIVLVSFPDEDAFNAWFRSPEYVELAKHRHAGSNGSILLVQGLS